MEDKSLKKLCDKIALDTENKMRAILSKNGKTSTRIFNAIKIDIKTSGDNIIIKASLPDYAKYVDQGRKPGKQPPLDAIIEWCKRKNIDKKAAFPIARKIGRLGIKPTNFMSPIRDLAIKIRDNAGKIVVNQILDIIRELKNKK